MQRFCRANHDRYCAHPKYKNAIDQFDGAFFYSDYPKKGLRSCLSYFGKFKTWEEAESKLLNFNGQRLILVNEAFTRSGATRNHPLGDGWIAMLYRLARATRPDIELWINDFSPRSFPLWGALREYLRANDLRFDGVGIQFHLQIGREMAPDWAISEIAFQCLRFQVEQNQKIAGKIAFSEVTVFPSNPTQNIIPVYNSIYQLAEKLNIEWLQFWSPTDHDSWHWDKTKLLPCGLFDYEFNPKPGIAFLDK